MTFKLSLTKNAINWERFDAGRELRDLQRRLERLEKPRNLMEVAIMQGSKGMWSAHMNNVWDLKKQIKEKEEEFDRIVAREEEEKEKKLESKETESEETEELPEMESEEWESLERFPPTGLEEFDFADDMSSFARLADICDRRGFFDAADIIDGLIEKQAEKMDEESRKEAKKIRLKRLAAKKDPLGLPYLFERYEERLEEKERGVEPIIEEEEPSLAYETEEEEGLSDSEYELLDLFKEDQDVQDIIASLKG